MRNSASSFTFQHTEPSLYDEFTAPPGLKQPLQGLHSHSGQGPPNSVGGYQSPQLPPTGQLPKSAAFFSSGGGGHTYNSSPSSSTANSHSGDDVSLATLESLTDLLPMMPASEAIKLSLKDLDTDTADLASNGGGEKPVLSELSPPLPVTPSGSSSSNYSTISLTPPPPNAVLSYQHSQATSPEPPYVGGHHASAAFAHLHHLQHSAATRGGSSGYPGHHQMAAASSSSHHQHGSHSHFEFACSSPEVTSLFSDFGVPVSNTDAEWLDNLIKL